MYSRAVGLQVDPNQDVGESAKFNFRRYVDAEGTAIMDTGAFDSAL